MSKRKLASVVDATAIAGGSDNDGEVSPKKTAPKERAYYARDIIQPLPIPKDINTLKIMSWNIPGLRGAMKSHTHVIEKLLSNHSPDILCLQETKLQESHVPEFDAFFLSKGYKGFWSCSTVKKGYAGTVVLLKEYLVSSDQLSRVESSSKKGTLKSFFSSSKPTKIDATDERSLVKPTTGTAHKEKLVCIKSLDSEDSRFAGEGRLITVEMTSFYLVAAYVPNSGQDLGRLDYRVDSWDPYIRSYLAELRKLKPVVYTGDMNVGHLDLDIYNYTAKHIIKQAGLTPRERQSFSVLLNSGFHDAFRYLYPTAKGQFTYWSQRTFARTVNCGIRLDYFICSENLFPSGMTCNSSMAVVTRQSSVSDVTPDTQEEPSTSDSSSPKKKKLKTGKAKESLSAADIVELSQNPVAFVGERKTPPTELVPTPGVLDSYILHSDTEPCSDHCPVVLIVRI